jgi:phosphoenolpyruvate carboxykinase (ATP)
MLAEKMARHGTHAWLVNTGWTGGRYGVGSRIKLRHTRAILDAIHAGGLDAAPSARTPVFGLAAPLAVPGVPPELLDPASQWDDKAAFADTLRHLAEIFDANFKKYADGGGFVSADLAAQIVAAGPDLSEAAASADGGGAADGNGTNGKA